MRQAAAVLALLLAPSLAQAQDGFYSADCAHVEYSVGDNVNLTVTNFCDDVFLTAIEFGGLPERFHPAFGFQLAYVLMEPIPTSDPKPFFSATPRGSPVEWVSAGGFTSVRLEATLGGLASSCGVLTVVDYWCGAMEFSFFDVMLFLHDSLPIHDVIGNAVFHAETAPIPTTTTPEPASVLLLAFGLLAVAARRFTA